jgi:membrane associated rhomboid family serine protease
VIPLHDNVPTRRLAVVTLALIAANVLVFVLFELGAADRTLHSNVGPVRVNGETVVTAEYGFVPCELANRCPRGNDRVVFPHHVVVDVPHRPVLLTVVTAMFLHGGWAHLLGNMLFLWIFGNNVEDRLGRVRFLLFYLLGGVCAAALQFAGDTSSAIPNIGASGAIAAVLGGYLLLYPKAFVITYIPPIFFLPLPAVLFLVGWFAFQVIDASAMQVGNTGGGVAYLAHVGGFLFGLLTIRLWARRAPPAPPRFGYA